MQFKQSSVLVIKLLLFGWFLSMQGCVGQSVADEAAAAAAESVESDSVESESSDVEKKPEPTFEKLPPLSKDWKRITKEASPEKVWVNAKKKQVVVSGNVCLTKGYLEMFACVANTKEHESVVALDAKSQTMHFALLGIGAEHGKPAIWTRDSKYTPASGQTIDVFVEWMKDGTLHRIKAQQWIRDLKTKKPMAHEWVFAGSSMWTDPDSKKTYYRADGGEAICVSNFPVAMMDLPIESSQANEELAFEALTENIPKRRTPVRLYLVPKTSKSTKKNATSSVSAEPKKQ